MTPEPMVRSAVEEAAVLGADLRTRYSEPHRAYHDLAHVDAVLRAVDELAAALHLDPAQHETARLAAWFHDAIYVVARNDNEERSASLAEQTLAEVGADEQLAGEVARLVRLTATHTALDTDLAAAVLVDADLAILGADSASYRSYAAAVRREYAQVPDDTFRAGRASVLRRLLDRTSLYVTPAGRQRWERAAHENLTDELEQLSGG
jgi:predicted metal-dependent HD superfamily phosphohydrolase